MTVVYAGDFNISFTEFGELENQRIRLQACFPNHVAWTSATSKPFAGVIFHALVFKNISAEHLYQESDDSVTDAANRLLSNAGITRVEQYIRTKTYKVKGAVK